MLSEAHSRAFIEAFAGETLIARMVIAASANIGLGAALGYPSQVSPPKASSASSSWRCMPTP